MRKTAFTDLVIDEENGIYGPVYSYSVKEYADYIIDHQDDSEIYAKAVDLVMILNSSLLSAKKSALIRLRLHSDPTQSCFCTLLVKTSCLLNVSRTKMLT